MNRPNPTGVHFIFTHKSQAHYDFIRDMQPGILKIVDSSTPDVQQIADSYAAAPGAILYLRNVARSEQHDFLWRDPIGCARQHVQEWHADLEERQRQARERGLTIPDRSQMHILGINEPVVELFARQENMSNYDEWLAMVKTRAAMLDDHMVEFGQQANALGYPVGLGNISSGQPANLRPGAYATFDWFPKTRKFLEATRDKNAYTSHEYWRAETGPEGHADWHAWRFMHLELDANIDILENGVDQKITTADPNGNRGWTGHMDAAAYVDQHRRYLARARKDSRFRGATPFTLNGDKIWESFWIDYCMPEMLALSAEMRASEPPSLPPVPQPTPPIETRLPWVGGPDTLFVAVRDGANIRQAPAVESAKLGAAPLGTRLTIVGATDNREWMQVEFEGVRGWVLAALLSVVQPAPAPVTTPQPTPSGDKWARSRAFIARWEGGYQNVANDKGNWTGGAVGVGENKGTNFGISAASYPHLDIRNLTLAQADAIYERDYWQASGAAQLDYPACLIVLDTAVLHGVGTAKAWLKEVGPNPYLFAARRLRSYLEADNWEFWDEAWIGRVIELLEACGA